MKNGQVFIKSSELISGYCHPSLLQLHFTLKHYALTFKSNTYISPSPLLNSQANTHVAYRCISLRFVAFEKLSFVEWFTAIYRSATISSNLLFSMMLSGMLSVSHVQFDTEIGAINESELTEYSDRKTILTL